MSAPFSIRGIYHGSFGWLSGISSIRPTISRSPSMSDGERSRTAATLHVPGIFVRVSANGPITAIVPVAFRGRVWLSFFKSTKLSEAMRRAASRCERVNMSRAGRFGSQYLYGSSNNPSLYLASKIRRQAVFRVIIETFPSWIDFFSVLTKPSLTISMSTPALMARAETVWRSPIPWSIISEIPV